MASNGGSALTAGGLATSAFVVTNTAAAAAALGWVATEWLHHGKPTVLGAISGCVAGLVAITPGSGFVGPMSSIIIGLVAGIICYFAVSTLKTKLGYDDALDAFGIHGIGGTWGAIATGIFCSKAINSAGADGLLFGNPEQVIIQIKAALVSIVFAAAATFIIIKVVGLFTKIRATVEEEVIGLDLPMHGERAYDHIF